MNDIDTFHCKFQIFVVLVWYKVVLAFESCFRSHWSLAMFLRNILIFKTHRIATSFQYLQYATRHFCNDVIGPDVNKIASASWCLPVGHKTGINIYNTETAKQEEFILPHGKIVRWYVSLLTNFEVNTNCMIILVNFA